MTKTGYNLRSVFSLFSSDLAIDLGTANTLVLPESRAAEEEVRLEAVLSWLGANPGWLLILDNVDAPAAVAEADRTAVAPMILLPALLPGLSPASHA